MGAIEHATEVPAPVSVLIYSSSIIYGQLGLLEARRKYHAA